jgi:hypothetical protein
MPTTIYFLVVIGENLSRLSTPEKTVQQMLQRRHRIPPETVTAETVAETVVETLAETETETVEETEIEVTTLTLTLMATSSY